MRPHVTVIEVTQTVCSKGVQEKWKDVDRKNEERKEQSRI